MRLLISGSWVRAPRWAISFWLPFLRMDRMLYTRSFTHVVSTAPWLSWLKRLSSKQEIPSSNLGGASFWGIQRIFLGERNIGKKQKCRDPGSNRGPLDLQSNALPTELSRQQMPWVGATSNRCFFPSWSQNKSWIGSTEIWTRIAGFRVQSANHYTMEPWCM